MNGHDDIQQKVATAGRRRRWSVAVQTAVALGLAAAVAAMLHYLALRHHARADWSQARYFSLSDKTRSLLAHLTNSVEAIVLFQKGHALLPQVEPLLREYQYAARRLAVRRVDPERDVAATQDLARRFSLTEVNVVVFTSEGRWKTVTIRDIADYDYTPVQRNQPPLLRAFKGEQAFTSALNELLYARTPVVYFLAGHGERPVDSFERGAGYAELVRLLQQDNAVVKPLLLDEEKGVPPDAAALVIGGPTRRLPQPEVDLLGQYLQRSGRLIVLLDSGAHTGLEPLLERWGIRVGDDLVVDPARTLSGGLLVSRYSLHPITENMRRIASVFYHPRSIEPVEEPGSAPAGNADRPHAIRFAFSSMTGWAESDPSQKPMRLDAGRDRPGPVGVAAAVERGPAPGLDMQIRPTRLVVFGDSGFVANGGIVSGNADLFLSALNWTLDREELIAIAPKTPGQMKLDMTGRQLRVLGWVVIAGLPLILAVAGLLIGWRRRA